LTFGGRRLADVRLARADRRSPGAGPKLVRAEPLAKALGVNKGGFYRQFDGRNAVLNTWEHTLA
jgi:hypothetical protein